MLKKGWFQMLIAIAILIVTAFTAREAIATSNVNSQRDVTVDAKAECASLLSKYSLHTEIVNGRVVTFTEDGPTGIDGGLNHLLSAYRTCSE